MLASAGLGNREIADRLVLSIRTVANHLSGVYERLGVNDRSQLARLLAPLPSTDRSLVEGAPIFHPEM